ncbi:hypothetical protein VE01_04614 [Pseudogymnoascus verrucosus]|uniref:Uncharacterized protein n=1 Tax=Pseudogymnoascus verrucosus TaxID=342668 RepID=A0A1B8GNA3_9PEZI|nr:uncharacterized protein VE01_04614 [Pseudogymnoascus verrucosus]OBT97309.2 hypothetical protein VE01_04614 [Pseudogymnoascus verrucosus]
MALIKFLVTALAATLMFTSSVLANPIPALTDATTTPDTTANHLEKRTCNEFGCGLKCKSSIPCNIPINEPRDCSVCNYFTYAADGTAKLLWDRQCLLIQWDVDPPLSHC